MKDIETSPMNNMTLEASRIADTFICQKVETHAKQLNIPEWKIRAYRRILGLSGTKHRLLNEWYPIPKSSIGVKLSGNKYIIKERTTNRIVIESK